MHARRAAAEREIDIVEEDDRVESDGSVTRPPISRSEFRIWVEDEQVQNASPCRSRRSRRLRARGDDDRAARSRSRSSRSATVSPPGFGLDAGQVLSRAARGGAEGARSRRDGRQRRRLRRHGVRWAGAPRMVGPRRGRHRHRRAWRQRRAPRHRSGGHAKGAVGYPGEAHRPRPGRASCRHARAAQSRRRLREGVQPDLSGPRGGIRRAALSVLPGRRGDRTRRSISRTACIRTRRAWRRSSRRCFRMWRRSSRKPPPATELTSCRATRRR